MAKNRTIVNLSPSFIKVMPFKCTGTNLITLESFTNSFKEVKEGLVCIFRASSANTEAVRVKLSKIDKNIRLLTSKDQELVAGYIKPGRFYEATYNGNDLILHNEDLDIEPGANVSIQRKPDGTIVLSSTNTDTWRPISDDTETEDSKTSASLKSVFLTNEKIKSLEMIINKTISLKESIGEIENVLEKHFSTIKSNYDDIGNLKDEITIVKKGVAEAGKGGFIEVQKIDHKFRDGDVLAYDGNTWSLADINDVKNFKQGKAICIVKDKDNFTAHITGIFENIRTLKDVNGDVLNAGDFYFLSDIPGKITKKIENKKMSQPVLHIFTSEAKEYVEVLLQRGVDIKKDEIDIVDIEKRFSTKEELESFSTNIKNDIKNIKLDKETKKEIILEARNGMSIKNHSHDNLYYSKTEVEKMIIKIDEKLKKTIEEMQKKIDELSKPTVEKPGLDNPGLDKPGLDNPYDTPGLDRP